jgi:hypothetical protein
MGGSVSYGTFWFGDEFLQSKYPFDALVPDDTSPGTRMARVPRLDTVRLGGFLTLRSPPPILVWNPFLSGFGFGLV